VDEFFGWVEARRHRGALLLAASMLLPPLGILGGGLLVYLCLRRDPHYGLVTAAFAALILSVLSLAVGGPAAVGRALTVAAINWLPLLGLAAVQTRYRSLSLSFQVAAATGFLILLVGLALVPDVRALALDVLRGVWEAMAQLGFGRMPEEAEGAIVSIFPGLFVGFMALGYLVSLFIGCWWYKSGDGEPGFGEQFRQLRLGRLLIIVVTVVIGLAILTGWVVMTNLAWMFLIFLVLQGLSVAHYLVAERGLHKSILVMVYVLLILVGQIGMPVLAGAGFLDNWLDVRKRI
jgi:hypothetical protein